jgi:hypothetical protein
MTLPVLCVVAAGVVESSESTHSAAADVRRHRADAAVSPAGVLPRRCQPSRCVPQGYLPVCFATGEQTLLYDEI